MARGHPRRRILRPARSAPPARTAWSGRQPWCAHVPGARRAREAAQEAAREGERSKRQRRTVPRRRPAATTGRAVPARLERLFLQRGTGGLLDRQGLRASSPWTCTTTGGACGRAPTAAMWPTWTTTTPRSRRRSASSAALRPDGCAPPSLTLMGHSTGGLIAALWASRHPGQARAAGPGQPVAGGARQPCRAPRRAGHGGAARPVPARVRDPAAAARLLLAQHQQRGRGRMGPGRRPSARRTPSRSAPAGSARCWPARPGWRGAWTSRCPSSC